MKKWLNFNDSCIECLNITKPPGCTLVPYLFIESFPKVAIVGSHGLGDFNLTNKTLGAARAFHLEMVAFEL
jgi:hypothetical protein